MFIHLMAVVASTWSRERCGISPLDAVVSRPGVSIFIVDFAASFRCKVKEPRRGFKWEDKGAEEGKGEVQKVNRGGPILPSLIMDFPRSKPHPSDNEQPQSTMSVPSKFPSQFYLQVQHGKNGGGSHDLCA